MEKIHNNLNIENLIKTDWFKQFSINQKQEILKGLEEDVMYQYMLNQILIVFKWKKLD